MKTFFSNKLR
ncbi:hypothetical protein CH380_17440 [Leptospira adleri]|uniref:Uncharacterized protein n=1 Tax=Leptospira adleri TaxID=2023186 RepID=A0A2M9YKJ4_9LEPT|nr:hypothetical protein CH380_17440 [Leptospira adleri]PJZ61005.1 hypothetical protein CH376_15585 [Leptospira adleri]